MPRALVTLLILAALAVPSAATAEPLLPDLRQETPSGLEVATDGNRFHLGFRSVVYNYGDGPLRIEGRRTSTADPTMTADQVIDSSDGAAVRVERVGRLRYVDAITHRHWHYLKFDTYSLLRTDGTLARPDRKTGFCLGDRLEAPAIAQPLPAMPREPLYTGGCGYDEPDLLEVQEGISVGYGDDYAPQLEGQFVDITRLPAGRYQLVHTVNRDGALRERSLADNAASVLVDVRWRRGVPRVTQLARCPLSPTCPVAPPLSARRATRLAREALSRAYGVRSSRGLACSTPDRVRAACTWQRGTVALRYRVVRGRLFWSYSATAAGEPARRGRVAVPLGRASSVPVARMPAARLAYCVLVSARG